MLAVLVGCGDAEKEKAAKKSQLMQEYEFEKNVLGNLEKDAQSMKDKADVMNESIFLAKGVLSRMKLSGASAEDVAESTEKLNELEKAFAEFSANVKKTQNEAIQQRQKLNGIELKIRGL